MQRAQEIAFFFGEAMEFDFAGLAAKFFEFVQALFVHGRCHCTSGRAEYNKEG